MLPGNSTNSAQPGATNRADARCECGQLIAKLRNDGVELKCKRCKRIVLIPYSMAGRDAEVVPNVHL
jgi:hypothetical protein